MHIAITASAWLVCLAGASAWAQTPPNPFRPPATPLVTHDPYFSVWSMADRLTDDWSKHWTGANQAMCGMFRIDGKAYRFAGREPGGVPAMNQIGLEVWPTRTIYRFEAEGLQLAVTFLSPLLPNNLDVLSRPVTYVTFEARATDAKPHDVSIYFDCSSEWAVNTAEQKVTWERVNVGGLSVLRVGTQEQPVLAKSGDNLRIDWGYFNMAVPKQDEFVEVITDSETARNEFSTKGSVPTQDDPRMPRAANDHWPVLVTMFKLGSVEAAPAARHILLAYDDQYSIELMKQKLRPYWRRTGMEFDELLRVAENDYASLCQTCAAFDKDLMDDMTRVGGEKYARICALGYRVALAAQKLAAAPDGTLLMFPKENFSNGCISTVDVIYPAAPLYLLVNPTLLKAQLKPVLDYAASARWPWPFAPHDLGTYPLANGQVYGGGEKTEKNQMPVEESANMMILMAAIAKVEGNADFSIAYWPTLVKWAEYLRDKGLDPENQLCTDDFAGHLAHNANLSIKAIIALGAYASLCDKTGKNDDAAAYRKLAQDMAATWQQMADDGDHYRLAFDKPGTWSQKYNLVWDTLLDFHLFPTDVAAKEIAFYKQNQKQFGLPLDNRKDYTKLDWLFWTATLATTPADFEALIAPAYDFANQTPDRHPLTDWYDTVTGKQVGFVGRPVIGGLFIKMLADASVLGK